MISSVFAPILRTVPGQKFSYHGLEDLSMFKLHEVLVVLVSYMVFQVGREITTHMPIWFEAQSVKEIIMIQRCAGRLWCIRQV